MVNDNLEHFLRVKQDTRIFTEATEYCQLTNNIFGFILHK